MNSNFNNGNNRNIYLFVAALAILLLSGAVLLDVTTAMINDKPAITSGFMGSNGAVKYRFRAVYTGAELPASGRAYSAPAANAPASTAHHHAAAPAVSGSNHRGSNVGLSWGGNSAAGGSALHTSSSQQLRSYGGGTSAAYLAGGSAASAHAAASQSSSFSSTAMPALAISTRRPSTLQTVDEQPHQGTINKLLSWDDDEGEYVSDGGVPPEGTIDVDGAGNEYRWNGYSWVPTGNIPEQSPIGDAPVLLLLLLLAGYVIYRRNRLPED